MLVTKMVKKTVNFAYAKLKNEFVFALLIFFDKFCPIVYVLPVAVRNMDRVQIRKIQCNYLKSTQPNELEGVGTC